jgi:hypothetical protein
MKRYLKIDNNKTETGKRYIANAIYPRIPETEQDIYVIATAGDRYDILASQFYRDSSLWWIIASANNNQKGSLIPPVGQQIRIPADQNLALRLFNEINTAR